MTKAVRRALARRSQGDAGFTLMELVVAMMIIGAVLISLVLVQTAALVTTAQTKQRTQATAIANETMEELRALPWLVLSKGLRSTFQAAAGTDPNVTSGRFRPPASPGIDEVLVTATDQATNKLPLSGPGGTNKTVSSDPSIPGIDFTTRVYVTRADATADALTLSVVTTWQQKGTRRLMTTVVRSQAYAPSGGCGDRANQPFLGACQALFSQEGGVRGAVTSLSPVSADPLVPLAEDAPLLPSSPYKGASVTSASLGASSTSQQATTVDSNAVAPGVLLTPIDPDAASVGTASSPIANRASNDVGASGAAPPNPPNVTGVLSGGQETLTAGSATLTLTPGSSIAATARTSLTTSCQTGVSAGQGCASASTSGGSAGSVTFTLGGAAFVISQPSTTSASAFSARFTTAPGSSTVGCTSLTGAGCGSAGASRTFSGAVVLAKGPWTGAAAADGLVRVDGYGDSVLAQRGTSQKTTAPTTTRSATLKFWNGTAYSSVTVGPATSGTYASAPVTWSSPTGQTLTATAVITVTAAASLPQGTDAAECRADACGLNTDAGAISAIVTYVVTDGPAVYAFTASTDLGTSRAAASFKAAPLG